MSLVIILAASGIMGIGLILAVAGLRKATRSEEVARMLLAGQVRDLVRAVNDISKRTEGLARSVDSVAKSIPPEIDVPGLAADLAARVKASFEAREQVFEPRGARVDPLESVVAWWNRSRLDASAVAAALPSLRAKLPDFSINQVDMARGLVGLTFSPVLPGGFHETIILPEMSFMVGDLKAVFNAPPGTSDMCRIQNTIRPASIETQYLGASRTELVNFGLQKGLIEPGDVL